MQPISITPSAEKGSVALTIGENKLALTTEEVDSLLFRLVEVRPTLLPAPKLEPEPKLPRQLVAHAVRFYVHGDFQNGGVLLHLSHPAFGWTTWQVPPDLSLQLPEAMRLWRVPPVPKAPQVPKPD